MRESSCRFAILGLIISHLPHCSKKIVQRTHGNLNGRKAAVKSPAGGLSATARQAG
jgi:hypothetical protein